MVRTIAKQSCILILSFTLLTVATGASAVRYVNPTTGIDGGACDVTACQTIQYAISQAVAGDTVQLSAGTYFENSITIPIDLNIVGAGAFSTDIDGLGGGPIFTINANNVLIDKVTLRNGDAGSNFGGAILFNSGNLFILRSRLLDNRALAGGAIANYSSGQLVIFLSTLQGNTSSATGGAIACMSCGIYGGIDLILSAMTENAAGTSGGALYVDAGLTASGPVVVWLSALLRNNANQGGAIYAYGSGIDVFDSEVSKNEADSGDGGAIYNAGVVNIERSTLAYNTASQLGGAVTAYGSAELYTFNSTFSQNDALCSGGLYLLPNFGAGPVVLISNTTFYGNEATLLGCPQHISNGASLLDINNTIIEGGLVVGGALQPACAGSFVYTTGTHNRIVDTSCDNGVADFNLGPVTGLDTNLAFNGGPTRTHNLIYKPWGLNPVVSNAIDMGENVFCPAVDQRAKPRPVDHIPIVVGGVPQCDIGAVELQ